MKTASTWRSSENFTVSPRWTAMAFFTAPAGCVTQIIGATTETLATSDPTYASRLGRGHADVGASTAYASSNPCLAGDDQWESHAKLR